MSVFTKVTATKIATELLLPQALTAALELVINKALLLNRNTNLPIQALIGKTLSLDLAELSFPLSFTVNSQAKILLSSLTELSDCTVTTSVNTLKKLKAEQQITQLIKQGELDVIGDVKIAQQFAVVAQSLAIDWQTELAEHIGDVPTHKILQFGNTVTQAVGKHASQLQTDFGEYIVNEKRLVATKSQVKLFNQQVTDVSEEVDRINSRVNELFSQLSSKK